MSPQNITAAHQAQPGGFRPCNCWEKGPGRVSSGPCQGGLWEGEGLGAGERRQQGRAQWALWEHLEPQALPLSSPHLPRFVFLGACVARASTPGSCWVHSFSAVLENQAVPSTMQPLAFHSLVMQRGIFTSPTNSQQLYRHLAAATPVGSSWGPFAQQHLPFSCYKSSSRLPIFSAVICTPQYETVSPAPAQHPKWRRGLTTLHSCTWGDAWRIRSQYFF